MKRILSFLLCFALVFVCAACGETSEKESNESKDNKVFQIIPAKSVAKFDDYDTVVVCWGDDITQGMAMPAGFTYPQYLQEGIGSAYRVLNAGVPGEATDAILSRANAIEFHLTEDVTFDKGEKQYTLYRNMFTAAGSTIPITYNGFGNQLKLSKVIIGGESYTIEFESGETYDNGVYYLTRKDTSKELTIPAGTKVTFDYSEQMGKIYCNVILIGANDGNQGAETLIEKYKKLTALNENYIVIIPFYSSDYSKEFKEAFGDKAIDIRDYMMNQAHIDYGIQLTKRDESCIRKGMIPSTYCYKENSGDFLLNEKGYRILGEQVYKKGVELGYWK